MYTMIYTCPYISQAVSLLSHYKANLGKEYQKVVQQTFRYLKRTFETCLCFGRSSRAISRYIDSNFTRDLDKRRSLISYIYTHEGYAISQKASLQPTMVLLTTKIEYMTFTEAIKEDNWLKGFFNKLCYEKKELILFYNSQSATYFTNDQMFHECTKHIDDCYHFVCDIFLNGDICIKKITTLENPIDMQTKPLSQDKFKLCQQLTKLTHNYFSFRLSAKSIKWEIRFELINL